MFALDEIGKKLIHEIKYHGVKEVLGDMPIWLSKSEGFREFLEALAKVAQTWVQPKFVDCPCFRKGDWAEGESYELYEEDT